MSAYHIAHALAGPRAQRLADNSYLVPCPVPSHGKGRGDRHPSLHIADGTTRLLVRCYAGCDPRDVLDEVRRRGLIEARENISGTEKTFSRARAAADVKEGAGPSDRDHERRQREKAAWLSSRRKPIAGTIAGRYLRVRLRGYTGPLPPTLGFLPAWREHHPALIAIFGIVDEIEPGRIVAPRHVEAVHLTLLLPDGSGKADCDPNKIVVGSPGGLPIVIAPPNDLLGLAICEGIEDALTVRQATGLGAWAAGSAGFMPKLADVVPSYIDCVTIYAHRDTAGQTGALTLAKAISARGIQVLIEAGR